MAEVRFTRVAKRYGAVSVIPELDLTVPSGSFTVLVGPSGCGKSTLLRMVAGLEEVSAGTIHIDGQDVTHADPAHRGIAMVFQSYALYPHMSVADNIGFGLRLSGMPKAEVARQVKDAADILQLGHLLDRKPPALSGGQRQRVAIGRAIVRKPKVFLFDEPLSNLDAALRAQMRIELAELHARLGATMIYVTHDQVEAMTMADQIVVLSGGHIEQAGPPMQLYRAPQTEFVAGFIGSPKMNFITGAQAAQLGAQTVGIRPEHLVPGEHGPLRGRVRHVEHLGGETLIPADIDGIGPMTARVNGECDIAHAAPIAFGYDSGALHRFTGGNRIADPV